MSLLTALITAQLLAPSCSLIAEPLQTTPPQQVQPALSAGQEQFLLAWVNGLPYPHHPPPTIRLTRLSATGKQQGPTTELSPADPGTVASDLDIAFNGLHLVVWQAFREATGWDIEAALVSVTDQPRIHRQWSLDTSPDNQSQPRVIAHDQGFAVGWSRYRNRFYRPYIVTLDPDGQPLHEGPLLRPPQGFSGYDPGWGFTITPDTTTEFPELPGQNLLLQSLDGELWAAWEDKSQWAPGKNGSISWYFARLSAVDKGWKIEQLMRPTSPLLGRTNGRFICYQGDICLFSGASVVGRGQSMAPAVRFNPQTLTHYRLDNAPHRKHSGWDKETFFPLLNEAYSLHGPIDMIATSVAGEAGLSVAGVAQISTRHESPRYRLIVSELKGLTPPAPTISLLESDTPLRRPDLAVLDHTHLVAVERALPQGGIQIQLCPWQGR